VPIHSLQASQNAVRRLKARLSKQQLVVDKLKNRDLLYQMMMMMGFEKQIDQSPFIFKRFIHMCHSLSSQGS
jgi:hypothetical protein